MTRDSLPFKTRKYPYSIVHGQKNPTWGTILVKSGAVVAKVVLID